MPLRSVRPETPSVRQAAARRTGSGSSVETGDLFRRKASVLVAPGVFFGREGRFRITIGMDTGHLSQAFEALSPIVAELPDAVQR
ncbi:hypothetical protein [Nonomuraea sp. NPDC003804]|uniref:hypothetical protein n=1 Tax=Nonomuraea sp. NPDC003804 TaxID=3154547 RepID=UPI00339E46E5